MLRQALCPPLAAAWGVQGGPVSRRVVGVTLDNLNLLPKQCRQCVFWELAPHIREQAEDFGQIELEKESWVSGVLLEWGSCGRIVMSGDVPAGSVLYAPPGAVPRASAFWIRFLSTNDESPSKTSISRSRPVSQTASAASSVHPPTKTESRRNSFCSGAFRSS